MFQDGCHFLNFGITQQVKPIIGSLYNMSSNEEFEVIVNSESVNIGVTQSY